MPHVEDLAILSVDGHTLIARPREIVRVARRREEVGKSVNLDKVLVVRKGQRVLLGQPVLKGARVVCEVKAHGRERKVISYRFKRRKNVRRKRGHRTDYTDLWVKEIKTE